MSLFILSVIPTKLVAPFLSGYATEEKNLPYPGWQFYDVSNAKRFWITYVCQVIFTSISGMNIICYDGFLTVLTLYICAQANVVKYRLRSLPFLERNMQYKQLVLIVQEHISIYRYKNNYCVSRF